MKRFKDNNSQNIVTSQKQNIYRWINELRSLQNIASLGEVELTGHPGVMIPKMPDIKNNWSEVVKIMGGVKQKDEQQAINLAYKLGGVGAVMQVAEFLGKLPIVKTGFSYVGLYITIAQGISLLLAKLKVSARAKFMEEGGKGIYDSIKNILKKEYTFRRYKWVEPTGSFGSTSGRWVPDTDKPLTLSKAADIIMNNGLEADGSSFRHSEGGFKYLFHLKNQADADEINQMIYQLTEDDKVDALLSKYLPLAGFGTAGLGWSLYSRFSDPKTKNPNPKQRKTDALGQPVSITQSTPEQREQKQKETFERLGIPAPGGKK